MSDPHERAVFLISRFGHFDGLNTEMAQRELLQMGEKAVDALVEAVSDPSEGWVAAKLLGQIRVSTPKVLDALRCEAPSGHWPASALGLLSDVEWLAEQPEAVAAFGLTAPLRAVTVGSSKAIALDYRPLEAWMNGATHSGRQRIVDILAPGSAYAPIAASDLQEALRGLTCAHAVLRWHAAAVLRKPRVGRKTRATIESALIAASGDPEPVVRRLALLSLGATPGAIKRHLEVLERFLYDPDASVQSTARHLLGA